ncbi:MAG TPA: DUF177 domain-containing protein [Hyphomicrobiaceae bacterium]|jgi:hypothetical protein
MPGELAWEHAVQDIPEEGLAVERSASPGEREAIARSLELLGCRSLGVRYALVPRGGGHVHLSGSLQAQVEQTCVVTLEPLLNDVAASFKVDYWPETEMPEPSGGAVDMQEDEADLEPIVAGLIEVGRVVFESLAGAIDLFPRKPGVTFEQPEDGGGSSRPSPFAALARIKDKR